MYFNKYFNVEKNYFKIKIVKNNLTYLSSLYL